MLDPNSGNSRVLHFLQRNANQWVELRYEHLRCIVHSRVADCRKRGHNIECRRNGDRYEYRLVA